MHKRCDIEELIGKTITGFTIADNRESMTLTFSDGSEIVLEAFGDCCSETWIESIDAPEALYGTVQGVEDIKMPDLGNITSRYKDEVDEVKYYGLKITTDKGRCVIDYRNSSNGYYGGDLVLKQRIGKS